MTRDELRKHCEKTVETQLRYKNSTNGLEQFHSKKVLSEHQLILELLDADAKWLKALEDIKAEIEAKERVELSVKEIYFNFALEEVIKIIDRKVNEVEHG